MTMRPMIITFAGAYRQERAVSGNSISEYR